MSWCSLHHLYSLLSTFYQNVKRDDSPVVGTVVLSLPMNVRAPDSTLMSHRVCPQK
uniref:Uncharacterized protein n=1 Tax=Arundo donax TaxID=35708 RepID=A0A0A9BL03_ARUDO